MELTKLVGLSHFKLAIVADTYFIINIKIHNSESQGQETTE